MIRHEIVATIPGDPQPKGSLKCVGARGRRGHVLVEDNTQTKPWRAELVRILAQTVQRGPNRQPIAVEITSTLRRPRSHYGTGRNAERVKLSSPVYPTGHGTGDVDKLARLVLDALEDVGILGNDAQVIDVTSRKTYAVDPLSDPIDNVPDALPYPGVVIRVRPYR